MRTAATVAAALLALLLPDPARAQAYDLVLRGGMVVDGTGAPPTRADVAVQDGRIAAVGDLAGAGARRILDVTGLHLAPGFIDTHSHAGPGLASPELSHARPLLAQGITTVFVNPDGGGRVDLAGQRQELLAHGLGVNVALFVPHGSVRRAVMGTENRLATPGELEEMAALVRAGMEAGAFGLSSGPFYVPGSYSDTRELVELARVAAAYGGVYQSHVRDESDYSIGLLAALDEVITVAREAGLPGVHTHVKALGPPVWGYGDSVAARVNAARARGVEVYADQYPYTASATSLGAALIPRWAQSGGRDSLRARLSHPGTRARIREEAVANLARRGGADRIQFRRVRWDESLEGRLLSEVAAGWGVTPVDAALRMEIEGSNSIVSFNMDVEDVRTLMRQPWTMTASDGGLVPLGEGVPHPRSYGSFPRKIRQYVLEEGVLSLEAAVRSMTGLPARVYGLEGRGVLEVGRVADLVMLDLDRVDDPAVYTDPHRLARGVAHLLVAGEFVIRDGRFTGVRAGEVLRR